jgi:hypothetical protein
MGGKTQWKDMVGWWWNLNAGIQRVELGADRYKINFNIRWNNEI